MIYRRRTLDIFASGVVDALSSQARDRLLLERVAAGRANDTLRFYRVEPCVSVGRHQALARELRLDYCRRAGITIVRRLTGGGGLYGDPGQLGFSLVTRVPAARRRLPLPQLLAMFAAILARALEACGVAARVKLPNDVEVNGGKLGSVYAVRHCGGLLVQGTVLIEVDVERVLEALRVPTEKLTADGLAAARDRFAPFTAVRGCAPAPGELESALIAELEHALRARSRWRNADEAGPGPGEQALRAEAGFARHISWEKGARDAVEAVTRSRCGATLRARARFGVEGAVLEDVEFATDAHLEPAGFLCELRDALRGQPVALAAERIRDAARRRALQLCGLATSDLASLLGQLAAKHGLTRQHGFRTRDVNALMLHCYGAQPDLPGLLAQAGVMLVPYCAKPLWCKFRHRDGCSECGLCAVGEAYRIARERGMRVTTVTNYENLLANLDHMKAEGVKAYVGMCCGHFFVKRHRAFSGAGIPAVLMEVGGANCYELKQEREAYAGTFRAEARVDRALLERVAPLLPPPAPAADPGATVR